MQQEQPLERVVPAEGGLEEALHSVVKVYCTMMESDYRSPWQNFMQEEVTGSGFALCKEGRMLLCTNAHVVNAYTSIRVRKFGQVTKFKARPLLIAPTADLALLAVDDEGFWKNLKPLELGDVPRLYSNVAVVGYPFGGESGCVTRGIISRVDSTPYVRGAEELIVVQIDAAINSGNSGGPALDDDCRVAGVAFSGYAGSADNVGFVIPRSVIDNVLQDWLETDSDHKKKKQPVKWAGLCNLGVSTQTCENPALRRRLRAGDREGVLVTKVAALGCGNKAGFKSGDMIIQVDGTPVANDGTVPLRKSERVHYDHCVTSKRRNQTIQVEILRDGSDLTLEVTLAPLPRLVPLIDGFNAFPSYVIIAGLVFMPLSVPLIAAVCEEESDSDDDDDEADKVIDLHYLRDVFDKDKPDKETQIIVWTQTLAHDCNFGYEGLCRKLPRLHRFNHTPVKNLAHLAFLAGFAERPPRGGKSTKSSSEFYEFEFVAAHSSTTDPTIVVVDRRQADDAQRDILRRAKVPAPFSPDVKLPLRGFLTKETTPTKKIVEKALEETDDNLIADDELDDDDDDDDLDDPPSSSQQQQQQQQPQKTPGNNKQRRRQRRGGNNNKPKPPQTDSSANGTPTNKNRKPPPSSIVDPPPQKETTPATK